MKSHRLLYLLTLAGLTLVQLASVSVVAAPDGRPVAGREKGQVAGRAGEDGRSRDQKTDERARSERPTDDKATREQRRLEDGARRVLDEASPSIRDFNKEYNTGKLDFDDLAKKIQADDRRAGATQEDQRELTRVVRQEGKPTEVVSREAIDRASFERLNVDQPKNRARTHEAAAAAEFEKYWKSKLENSKEPELDYKIIAGRDKGKSVDFMLTETVERPDPINKNFDIRDFAEKLRRHVDKADIVPIEIRFLTGDNKRSVLAEIDKLRPEEQQKIVLINRE